MLPRFADRPRLARRAASLGAIAIGIVLPLLAVSVIAPVPVRGATHAVEIGDGVFSPASLNVAVGDTVTWTNVDDSPHTVTAPGALDSGNLDPGQSYSFTFTSAGTVAYVCGYHDEMTATITVAADSRRATSAPAPSTAAAPAAPTTANEAGGGHGDEQPDTALPTPAASTVTAWVAPLLIGVGLVAFAVGVVPAPGTRASVPGDRRRPPAGWRR